MLHNTSMLSDLTMHSVTKTKLASQASCTTVAPSKKGTKCGQYKTQVLTQTTFIGRILFPVNREIGWWNETKAQTYHNIRCLICAQNIGKWAGSLIWTINSGSRRVVRSNISPLVVQSTSTKGSVRPWRSILLLYN